MREKKELTEDVRRLAQRFADSCYGTMTQPPDRSGMLQLVDNGLVVEIEPGKFAETKMLSNYGF